MPSHAFIWNSTHYLIIIAHQWALLRIFTKYIIVGITTQFFKRFGKKWGAKACNKLNWLLKQWLAWAFIPGYQYNHMLMYYNYITKLTKGASVVLQYMCRRMFYLLSHVSADVSPSISCYCWCAFLWHMSVHQCVTLRHMHLLMCYPPVHVCADVLPLQCVCMRISAIVLE